MPSSQLRAWIDAVRHPEKEPTMTDNLAEELQEIADDVKMVLRAGGYPDARWDQETESIMFYSDAAQHDVSVTIDWA